MTYFADLSPCTYGGDPLRLDPGRPRVVPPPRAVGWLDADHPFPRGPVDPVFRTKLGELFEDPWEWGHFRGFHTCEICERDLHNRSYTEVSHSAPARGLKNLLVPGIHVQYFTPELILHYIDAHQYDPPVEFQSAIKACPPTRSEEYFRALFASAGRAYARQFARVLDEIVVPPEERWAAAARRALAAIDTSG